MADVVLSPTASIKQKTRESAKKIRHGSPKLQEVLRQRCRERMREQRGKLFNRTRFGLEIHSKDVQDTLTEILRKELSNLSTSSLRQAGNDPHCVINQPLNAEEALELEEEILAEEEQWILQEYEEMSQHEEESMIMYLDQSADVICPFCQKFNLVEAINCVACKMCGFTLSTCTSVKDLGHLITKSVNNHSSSCNETPGFMLFPDNNNICLHLICNTCSTAALII